MEKRNCIHPRKVHKLMKNFVNTASDLAYYDEDDEVYYKTVINLFKGDCFQADVTDSINDDDEQNVYYNLDELYEESSKIFRKYWTKKCPMLKGFSDITISLLHELGHLETNDKVRKKFSVTVRELALMGIENRATTYKALNKMYFQLPDEKAATEWAIKWLSKKKNRKVAKKFEREFFKYFE